MCIRSECVTSKGRCGDLFSPCFGGGVGRIPLQEEILSRTLGGLQSRLNWRISKRKNIPVSGTDYLNLDKVSFCLLNQWVRGIHFILQFTRHVEHYWFQHYIISTLTHLQFLWHHQVTLAPAFRLNEKLHRLLQAKSPTTRWECFCIHGQVV